MIAQAPVILNWLCAAFILIHSINVLGCMTPQTNHLIRVMYCLFSVGAFGVVIGPLFGVLDDRWGEVLINMGVTLYCVADRRRTQAEDDPRGVTPAH